MSTADHQAHRKTDKIRQQLEEIIRSESANTIRSYVADEALNYSDNEPKVFFTDLAHGGCQSGMVGSLIYYYDTHQFFDAYYDEIEELREDWEDCVGQPLNIKGDLKNWLAWFAFEETAFRLASELGIEI